MVALPLDFGMTTPVVFTAATDGFEDDHPATAVTSSTVESLNDAPA